MRDAVALGEVIEDLLLRGMVTYDEVLPFFR